jgi:DNA-binding transcriptional regulator YiaG
MRGEPGTGRAFNAVRKAMKLSFSNLSKAMGIRPSTLFRWENNPPRKLSQKAKDLISDFVFNLVDDGYIVVR